VLCDLFNFWKISDNISKTVRDSIIVSFKFEQEVVCALSNNYVADDLGWPLSTLNDLNFYILHCLMHLRNWWIDRKDWVLLFPAGPGKGHIAVACRITLNHPSTAAMRLSDYFHHLLSLDTHIDSSGENRLFMMIRIFAPKLPVD